MYPSGTETDHYVRDVQDLPEFLWSILRTP